MSEPAQVIPLHERRHVLYRMFNTSGELLYVGITADVEQRFIQHGRTKPWWLDVETIRVEHFTDRQSVEAAERDAIKAERPRYNRIHQPRPPRAVNTDAHTPVRSIRMSDELWDAFGAAVGERNRSAVINELVAWLLREPGAKLPKRIDPPA